MSYRWPPKLLAERLRSCLGVQRHGRSARKTAGASCQIVLAVPLFTWTGRGSLGDRMEFVRRIFPDSGVVAVLGLVNAVVS